MYLEKFYTVVVLILLSFYAIADRGVVIKGNYYPMEQRTSVNISKLSGILNSNIKNELVIGFDFKMSEHLSSGDMLRIKFNKPNHTLTLNHRVMPDHLLEFRLNIEGQRNLAVITLNKDSIGYNWLHAQITLDVSNGKVIWKLQNKQLERSISIKKDVLVNSITLGKDGYYVDVADFCIRNMEIRKDGENSQINFDESKGNILHTSDGNEVGTLTNPSWLINQSYYWQKTFQTSIGEIGGVQFDEKNDRFIIYCKDYLEFYDLSSKKVSRKKFRNKLPMQILLGSSYIADNKLVVYEVNNLAEGSPNAISIDLNTLDFSVISHHQLPMQLHHHIGFKNKESDYVIFGGFGNDRYSNTFVRFSEKTSTWDTLNISGDRISPRYFTSGYYNASNNKVYVFGGMGNDEGDKTLGREYFYDLYEVGLDKLVSKKIWQIEWKDRDLVPTRNLIKDNGNGFYVLMYPEYVSKSQLQLYHFSISHPQIEKLGNLIPIKSGKIKTSANLFFDKRKNVFYAVTQVYDEIEKSSQVTIFQLKAPPVGLAQLNQYHKTALPKWIILVVSLLFALCLVMLLWHFFFREPKYQKFHKKNDEVVESSLANGYDFPKQNAVFLFGTFKVLDNKGKDISYLFSNRLRQLFVFFLLNEKSEGITSAEISKNFWPDKSLSESKNIRGVTINQLRKILAGLKYIELKFDNHYYELVMDNIYVDYHRFKILSTKGDLLEPELYAIVRNGNFLEAFKGEAFDEARLAVENIESKILYDAMEKAFAEKNYSIISSLAKKNYQIDPLSSEVLQIELVALLKMGHRQQAKMAYERFCERYLLLMGEKFSPKFNEIVSA